MRGNSLHKSSLRFSLHQSLSDAGAAVVDPLIREASLFSPFVKIERLTFGATAGWSVTLTLRGLWKDRPSLSSDGRSGILRNIWGVVMQSEESPSLYDRLGGVYSIA